VLLSVVATAVIALLFDRVLSWLHGVVGRAVLGGHDSPYDVLRQFSGTVTGSYAAEELPARMARVLTQGTGVAWSQVWVVVGDRPVLAAAWPPDATGVTSEGLDLEVPGRRGQEVSQGGELLGLLVVQEREHVPLTSVEERLFAGLAGQAGLVLRGVRLRAELTARAAELSRRAEELRLSRQRLVDAQDTGRRRLERDIHDGAQQHLVALAVNLRLAQTLSSSSPDRAVALLTAQEKAVTDTVDTIVELSRGIHPRVLTDHGLEVALRAVVENSPIRAELLASGLGRYAHEVEAAVYLCALEAMQNAAKHSDATTIRVVLDGAADGSLSLLVEDDGAGFDPATIPGGSGLTNMRDRVEAVGGTLTVTSAPEGGTRIRGRFPTGVED
jgi:signal transduction histidine kinase